MFSVFRVTNCLYNYSMLLPLGSPDRFLCGVGWAMREAILTSQYLTYVADRVSLELFYWLNFLVWFALFPANMIVNGFKFIITFY